MERTGISNVVATIILIAVAIALAVAVAIWAFGLFKSTHAGTLQILDYRLYTPSNGSGYNLLGLEVENPTGTTFTIVSVTVGGITCTYQASGTSPPTNTTIPTGNANGIVPGSNGAVSVNPGATAWLYYTCPGTLQAGVQYDGTTVLSTGAILRFTVVAQPG